jgi:hypothetical protein
MLTGFLRLHAGYLEVHNSPRYFKTGWGPYHERFAPSGLPIQFEYYVKFWSIHFTLSSECFAYY